MKFILPLHKRLLFLLFSFLICYFVSSVLSVLILHIAGSGAATKGMRIAIVLQDLLVFAIPAVATAVFSTRQPGQLMCIERKPPLLPMIAGACLLIISVPAMNTVIWLNDHLPLPAELDATLRAIEARAELGIQALQGPHDIPNLIMTVLIVAVLAGVTEEMLFRGAFQRLMSTGGVNIHAAIWIAAAVFSLLHMQFFGFVPRMLLGAFFGYMLWWTGSLWVPMVLHVLNNTLYLVAQYLSHGQGESPIDTIGSGSDLALVAVSAAFTAAGLWLIRKISINSNSKA